MLKAVVIHESKKLRDLGNLLQIARHAARMKEHSEKSPPILALEYVQRLDVYIAVYSVDVQKPGRGLRGVHG